MSKKKLHVHRGIKIGLVIACSLIILLGIGLIARECLTEHTRTEYETLYEYTANAEMNYKVYMKPNMLYEESFLGENETYLSEFVDYIEIDVTSIFSGSQQVEIEGTSSIEAQVRGITNKNDEEQVLWQKVFPLKDEQPFKISEASHELAEKVTIHFGEYNTFAKSILEASKVSAEVELLVIFKGYRAVNTPYEQLNIPINLQLTLPLNKGYFTLTKAGGTRLADTIQAPTVYALPPDKREIMKGSILCLIGILGNIAVLLGIGLLTDAEKRQKQLKKILAMHGSRMISVQGIDIERFTTTYQLSSIEDLVKVADELEKPVIYPMSSRSEISDCYYVAENQILYSYQVPKVREHKKELDATPSKKQEEIEEVTHVEDKQIIEQEAKRVQTVQKKSDDVWKWIE